MPAQMSSFHVQDVMSKNVMTVDRNDKLSTVDDVMKLDRIRHMPVVDEDGDLVGIVSQRDLFLNGLLKALGYGSYAADKARTTLLVKEAMTTDVMTTTADTPLREAALVMRDKKIGCLVVVDGKRAIGIVTEGDFVSLFADGVTP
jgi:CBS domain-containing membrane protein